jgi:hypothetical protein
VYCPNFKTPLSMAKETNSRDKLFAEPNNSLMYKSLYLGYASDPSGCEFTSSAHSNGLDALIGPEIGAVRLEGKAS